MTTMGLASLTSLTFNELVIGEFDTAEMRLGHRDGLAAFQARISSLLGRDDLRAAQAIRWEKSPSRHGILSWRKPAYRPPMGIYACPKCAIGEARLRETLTWGEFQHSGGVITPVGALKL
jgi:hypothetical protein